MKKIHTLSLAVLLCSTSIFATVHTITVADFSYTPNTLTIDLGDTVRFSWASGNHPTISETGTWGAFVIKSTNPTKDIILSAVGTYAYYDYFSGGPGGVGMSGEITVILPPDACTTPTSITATDITATSALISWDETDAAKKYSVQYRVTGTHTWIKKNAVSTSISLIGLDPSTSYQYRVRPVCTDLESTFSEKFSFTTLAMRNAAENTISAVISPNPGDGKFSLQLSGFSGETTVNVYDVNGSLIYTQLVNITEPHFVLNADLREIATSMMIVKVNDAMHTSYSKLLIQ